MGVTHPWARGEVRAAAWAVSPPVSVASVRAVLEELPWLLRF